MSCLRHSTCDALAVRLKVTICLLQHDTATAANQHDVSWFVFFLRREHDGFCLASSGLRPHRLHCFQKEGSQAKIGGPTSEALRMTSGCP